jgi:hypothetical protein
LPQFTDFSNDENGKELTKIEEALSKHHKKGYAFPSEFLDYLEIELKQHPIVIASKINAYKSTVFSDTANLPNKKGHVVDIQAWNTKTKYGPKGMKIPIKLVEYAEPEFQIKSAVPIIKDYLTIDDLKMRASILAYAKYKRNIEIEKERSIKRF